VECAVIFGTAKGIGDDDRRSASNHGWNAVNLDGKWELVDATWGGGGATKVDGKLVHVKELDMRYLFADPADFSIDHFPEQKKWQLLDKPISKRTFNSDFYDLKRMAKLTKYGNN
jgi:transglutaminase/protease-like cytokinesis protein 3